MTASRIAAAAAATALAALLSAVPATAVAQGQRFVISADGQEVTDTQTQLTWRRCAEGMAWKDGKCSGKMIKFKFADAKSRATEAAKTDGKEWRVPTKEELSGLVIKGKKKPLIDAEAFPNTPTGLYWAKREGFDDNLNAWLVDFGNGKAYGGAGNKERLRLVRSAK